MLGLSQEFDRIARTHGLTKRVIPTEDQDSVYCADDIELWEVRCTDSVSLDDCRGHERECLVTQWNEDAVVLRIRNASLTLQQRQNQGIGCALWASSIVMVRYIVHRCGAPDVRHH